jgi:DNA-binding MarR family transcriptional regulator
MDVTGAEKAERADYVSTHLIGRAAVLVRLLVKEVRDSEISRTEGGVLSILSEGSRRITELAELEGVAQPTMTLLVKRLEEHGWVSRGALPEDGRVAVISITEAGSATLEAFRARFFAVLRADLEDLSEEELAALSSATEALGSFVDKLQRRVGTITDYPPQRDGERSNS